MTLGVGSPIGPYGIRSALGAGGMGQVYRARDTRLDRDVALKLLPDAFTADADRLARFEREAKTLASLNHPNIAHIYDTGKTDAGHVYLAMELVEGRTLETAIRSGNVEIDAAVRIARQIAEALEAAHEHGIIHRDLKPANVIVRDDDVVKVLDFGLARAMDVGQAANSGAEATRTSPVMTQAGWILGTAAYMSPEQARGRAVDRRADIWAFGVVLFEILTGRRLFEGETISDVVVAVLTQPIDLAKLPPAVPPRIRELIARCLERDPKRRLRDIGEARLLLENPDASGPQLTTIGNLPPQLASRSWTRVLPWAIAAIAVATAAALAVQRFRAPGAVPAGRLMLEVGPPPDVRFVVGSNAGGALISPDGSTLVFLGQTTAGRKLFVRSLATGETRALSGTEEAHYPFWSPDSRSLGFFSSSQLMTVAIAGGLPEAIAPIEIGRGGTWSESGFLLFTPVGGGAIHRVPERGGKIEKITTLDASRGENAHYFPVALPGGRQFLFFIRSTRAENNGIYLGSLDGKTKPVRLLTSLSSGLYATGRDGAPGRLLWVRDGELLAQTIDIEGARLTGDVTAVASDVRVEESQRATFASVSDNGTIVWASARASDLAFAWYDRTGRQLAPLPIAPGKIVQPRLSPDGRKLLFTRVIGGTADIWVHDIASGATTQVTTDPDYDENPSWSPDNRMLVYAGRINQQTGVLIAALNGSQSSRPILGQEVYAPGPFMPDGKAVIMSRLTKGGGADLAMVRLDRPNVAMTLSTEPGLQSEPAASPDGQWIAFTTDRTGRLEVVLARFIDDGKTAQLSGQRLPVSTAGGTGAAWRRDGGELIYVAPDLTLMAVSVTKAGGALALGKPTPLFRLPADAGGLSAAWSANADHTKFVVVDAPNASGQTFRVMTGWR